MEPRNDEGEGPGEREAEFITAGSEVSQQPLHHINFFSEIEEGVSIYGGWFLAMLQYDFSSHKLG